MRISNIRPVLHVRAMRLNRREVFKRQSTEVFDYFVGVIPYNTREAARELAKMYVHPHPIWFGR